MKKNTLNYFITATLSAGLFFSITGSVFANETNQNLTVWCWEKYYNVVAMEDAAAIYQKDHPNVTIDVVEIPWNDLQTKLTTLAVSGKTDELPDIFLMQDNAFEKNFISYPEIFSDITDSGIDFSQFASGKLSYTTFDGRNYGVPFDNGICASFYRTDILSEAGFSLDDFTDITWDEFIEKGSIVLEKTGKTLTPSRTTDIDIPVIMLNSVGGTFFDEEGNPNIANNDKLKAVITEYVKLREAGLIAEVNVWDDFVSALNNGSCAGVTGACWVMGAIQSAEDQSGLWGVTNMPVLDEIEDATHYANNGGSSWAISCNCSDPALAADFLGSTFGGSTELYDTILPKNGAVSTYLPAADSSIYMEPQEFYGGQTVFATLIEFSKLAPKTRYGTYFNEAMDAVATAITNIENGADMDAELQIAQETVEFIMNI